MGGSAPGSLKDETASCSGKKEFLEGMERGTEEGRLVAAMRLPRPNVRRKRRSTL